MRIRNRLLLGYFAGIIIILVVGMIGLFSRSMIISSLNVTNEKYDEVTHAYQLNAALQDLIMPANDYLISGDPVERDKYNKKLRVIKELLLDFKGHMESDGIDSSEMIVNLTKYLSVIEDYASQIFLLPPMQPSPGTDLMYSMDKSAEELSLIIKDHEMRDKKLYAAAIEKGKKSLKIIDASMIIGAIVTLIIAALFVFYIERSIRTPIEKLSRGIHNLDTLKWEKITIEDRSEIGEFATEYNKMIDRLKSAYEELEEKVSERTAELKEANDNLNILAITDGLTGAYNQRYFYEKLGSELERSERYNHPASLMIADVDDFKHYNDKYGHLAGDKVLRDVAECFRKGIRTVDIFARYGGEEFAVLMPETDLDAAEIIAERVRNIIEEEPFPDRASQPKGKITVSIGLASYSHGADTPKNLVKKADESMYKAKSFGKNRVEKQV